MLGEPETGQLFAGEDEDTFLEGLKLLLDGLAWAGGDSTDLVATPEARHAVLTAVRKLVPPRDGPVEALVFEGRAVGYERRLSLAKSARNRLDDELRRLSTAKEYTEVKGRVREIDLDENKFILRERPKGEADLACEYDERDESEIKVCLDQKVIVSGVLITSNKTKKQTMEVETIETLSIDEATGDPPA